MHAEAHSPRLVAKALLWSVVQAYEQDVPVWAHKRYEAAPRWTAKDASVVAYRRWVKQVRRAATTMTFYRRSRPCKIFLPSCQ